MKDEITKLNAVLQGFEDEHDELKKKIDDLDNAIRFIKERITKLDNISETINMFGNADALELKGHEFKKMQVAEAVIKCLKMSGKPMKTFDLINALLKGGIKSDAINKRNSLRNAIKFSKKYEKEYAKNTEGYWYLLESR